LTTLSGTYTGIVGGRQTGGYFVPLKQGTMTDLTILKKGAPPLARVITNAGKVSRIQLLDTGSGYSTSPTVTIQDNVNVLDVAVEARIASGVLSQPTFTNRGTGFINVSATVDGDGFADEYQIGKVMQMKELSREPGPGDLLYINGIADQIYRVTQITKVTGVAPNLTAQFRISPSLKENESPDHDTSVTIRQQYSQVRLTGHDFLDIGTGNITSTNYPGLPAKNPIPANEVVEGGGGRVFFTSTDQDGNFRVGDLFSVEQATGIASLNADAFNISGLQELQLGDLALGGTSASINEFSTDGTMAANSDAIVPTQRAIRTYIASQIGGGASSLNVNLITAGLVVITGNTISTSNNVGINFQSVTNFKKGVTGVPIAMNYLIHS